MDLEQSMISTDCESDSAIQSLAWHITSVRQNCRPPKTVLSDVNGILYAGQCCALMGPSGSGKTTLLNVLANRTPRSQTVDGSVALNGAFLKASDFRRVSCFVEHEESLIGGLTVFETLSFASRLASSATINKGQRLQHINVVLQSFGLYHEADTLVRTPFGRGISHGQKRRLAVSKQMVTGPKILFLDEPTSGLDSQSAYEVVDYLQRSAKRHNLIVICSIHQPSTSILALFDTTLLISQGKPCYFGSTCGMTDYFRSIGLDISNQPNPMDFLLQIFNTDFSQSDHSASRRASDFLTIWKSSLLCKDLNKTIEDVCQAPIPPIIATGDLPDMHTRILILLHRSLLKSCRDPLAYGIRLAFAASFGILIGTVWYHLDRDQESIESLVSMIYFAPSFMSLAAMIYGPSFIEDYLYYRQDMQDGLYGPTEFIISNFLIGAPFLFLISLAFSAICYWLSNLIGSPAAFFTWVLWIFATTLVAESLVVLAVTIFPDFMFTIALSSLFNSVLICTQGFFIPSTRLNVFYRYGFYYWNYLAYTFEGLMVTQFKGASYSCGDGCNCLYESDLLLQCQVSGEAVLEKFNLHSSDKLGKNVAIVIAIMFGFRLASWFVLQAKKNFN